MSVRRVFPRGDLLTLRDAMDRLFGDKFVRSDEGWEEEPRQAVYRLPLDVHSTSEEIVLAASVPGLTADEISIAIDGERLTIEGELRAPSENVDYIFRERPYGKFTRGLTLNVPIDIEKAEAEFENGVLTLILPKAANQSPK